MNANYSLLECTFSLVLPFFLLYTRNVKWLSTMLRFVILIPTSITGIVGFIYAENNEMHFVFYAMLLPIVTYTFDKLFKWISLKLHNRDFYLYLSNSSDVNDLGGLHLNPHILKSDIVISDAMVIIIVGLFGLGAVLLGKTNLFEEFCK